MGFPKSCLQWGLHYRQQWTIIQRVFATSDPRVVRIPWLIQMEFSLPYAQLQFFPSKDLLSASHFSLPVYQLISSKNIKQRKHKNKTLNTLRILLVRWHCDNKSTCDSGDLALIPGWGRSPGGGMATHPIFLPRESHGQKSLSGYNQPMGLQRVGHNWATNAFTLDIPEFGSLIMRIFPLSHLSILDVSMRWVIWMHLFQRERGMWDTEKAAWPGHAANPWGFQV